MDNRFQDIVEKEKNRVELNRAMYGPSILDSWRQILTVVIAAAIIAAVFSSRTRRFKNVMAKIEYKIESSKLLPAKRGAQSVKPPPPQGATESGDPYVAMDHAEAAAAQAATDEDAMITKELQDRNALAGRMERIASGDMREVMGGAQAPAREPSAAPSHRPTGRVLPADSIGIANGDKEELSLDAFPDTKVPDYEKVAQVPEVYAKQLDEFPDLKK